MGSRPRRQDDHKEERKREADNGKQKNSRVFSVETPNIKSIYARNSLARTTNTKVKTEHQKWKIRRKNSIGQSLNHIERTI